MPVSFRAHEAARISRAARVETAKADVANALVHGGGSAREPSGRDAGRVDTDGRASESAATTAKRPARSKLPSRGGVKRARSRGGRMWDTPAPDEPDDDETETKAIAAAAFKTDAATRARTASGSGSRDGPPASLRVSRELGWSDVVLQRLLLEGVPDRFLLEEGDLYLNATRGSGSARRAAPRGRKPPRAPPRIAFVRGSAPKPRVATGTGAWIDSSTTRPRLGWTWKPSRRFRTRRSRRCFERRRRRRWRARWREARWAAARGFSTRDGRDAPPREEGEEEGKGEKEARGGWRRRGRRTRRDGRGVCEGWTAGGNQGRGDVRIRVRVVSLGLIPARGDRREGFGRRRRETRRRRRLRRRFLFVHSQSSRRSSARSFASRAWMVESARSRPDPGVRLERLRERLPPVVGDWPHGHPLSRA